MVIANNNLHNCRGFYALWLDWMAQGTRVTGNFFHDNIRDLLLEVNHGPVLLDNNLFVSKRCGEQNVSDGIAFAHNIFLNPSRAHGDNRHTPYFEKHSTKIAGSAKLKVGDVRFYNNIFAGAKSSRSISSKHVESAGNVYLNGAKPVKGDTKSIVDENFDPKVELHEENGVWRLSMDVDPSWLAAKRPLVTTELLGDAVIPKLPFVDTDDKPYRLDKDIFGKARGDVPAPGPFNLAPGTKHIDVIVWPVDKRGK
jgi:alpha-N-arabinofuranosidase